MSISAEERLLDVLIKMNATVHEGEVVAPCPVCQEDETNAANFKMLISCGDKFLAVCFCRHCCNKQYSDNRRLWWSIVRDFYGLSTEVFAVPVGENSRRIWSSLRLNQNNVSKKRAPASVEVLHKVYNDLLHCLPPLDFADR